MFLGRRDCTPSVHRFAFLCKRMGLAYICSGTLAVETRVLPRLLFGSMQYFVRSISKIG